MFGFHTITDFDHQRVELTTDTAGAASEPSDEILRVHAALEGLAAVDARLIEVVEMRYFGGLSEAEIALALELTERTVRRDWAKARMLLAEALGAES